MGGGNKNSGYLIQMFILEDLQQLHEVLSFCLHYHTQCFTYKMSHIHKTFPFLAVLHLWPLHCDSKVWLPLCSWLMKINKISHIFCIYSIFCEWHYVCQTFNMSQVQTGTKLTNLPGWYQCLVPSCNAASWDPPADMDAAAYRSDQYSLVACLASFSDLSVASQVVACTVYNATDSIKCTYLLTYDSRTLWPASWKSMIPFVNRNCISYRNVHALYNAVFHFSNCWMKHTISNIGIYSYKGTFY